MPKQKNRFSIEKSLHQKGYKNIAGFDEAGRGCLAGPVFAAAVIFPPGFVIGGVDDSKKIAPSLREILFEEICLKAIAWAVARVEVEEIDEINIHHASLKAMKQALHELTLQPDFLLVDGKFPLVTTMPQRAVVRGDQLCHCVAAASILAKVSRDRWIREESKKYPEFSFAQHKGYGTSKHLEEIKRNGPTPLHRKSFRPLKNSLAWTRVTK